MKKLLKTVLLLPLFWVWCSLPLQSSSILRSNVVDTSYNYLGLREEGKNSGIVLDDIIKQSGGVPGQPWCMYFVYYCVEQACNFLKIKNPLYKTGSVSMQLRKCNTYSSKVQVIPVAGNYFKVKILRGDILIFKPRGFKRSDVDRLWAGHAGFGVKQTSEQTVETIEGNTNKKGSREGDGVYERTRNIYSKNFPIIAILRLRWAIVIR